MRINSKLILLLSTILLFSGQIFAQMNPSKQSQELNKQRILQEESDEEKNDGDSNTQNGKDDDDDDEEEKSTDNSPDLSKPAEIQIGQYYKINKTLVFSHNYQPVGYFFFKIDQKIERKDIVIMVRGREDFTHNPSLFYSTTNKFPDMTKQNEDVSCGLTGHDFCLIASDKIKANSIYYLGVHCLKSCNFEISVQYDQVYNQLLDNQVVYESGKEIPHVLDIQIKLPNDLSDKIEHILIESYILNFNMVNSNFHMFVNKGNIPPTAASYDYITEEMKLNGQAILLERDTDKFAAGQIYSVAIEIPPRAKMLVRSDSFEKERQLLFYKSADDMVRKGQLRIFKLEITQNQAFEWDEEELSIDLEPYFGNPDLYVNHGSLPQDPTNLSSYRWSSTEQDGLESLTITKGSIDNKSKTGEVFYIAVYGESAASFRLLAYSSSLDQREILFNAYENGYALYNEVINYELNLEYELDSDLTIKLSIVQGDGQLFIKRCIDAKKVEDCEIKKDDIDNKDLKQPAFYRSDEQGKEHKIQFKYLQSECIDDKTQLNKCTFVVGVIGTSKGQTKFRLLAKHTVQPTLLRENEEHRSYLKESESEYYKFLLNQEDPDISKIEFTITTISGELIVYSSRQNEHPSQQDHEKAELSSQDVIVYKKNSKTNPSLKGQYYIGVTGISGCIYSLYVKIYRHKDHHEQSIMKQLELGSVEKGYLTYQNPVQYYFSINPKEVTAQHQTNIVLYYDAQLNQTNSKIDTTKRVDPHIQISYQVNNNVYNVTRFQEDYISSDFIYIKILSNFTEANGKYVITLTHKQDSQKDYKIKYQLNVNAQNIIYIVPRGAYIQDLNSSDNDNYELYLNEPSKVYLEVFECFGKVKVQAASSIDNIEKQDYNIKSKSPARFIGDHTIVNYERDTKGPLFFSVQATSQNLNSRIKALYMIIPHIFSQKQVTPHDVFSTPAEGQIQIDIQFNYDEVSSQYHSSISITYGAIECANDCVDSIYKPKAYSYFVHITNKDNFMQYFAKCNMQPSALKVLGFNDTDIVYEKKFNHIKGSEQPGNFTDVFSKLRNGTYFVEVMGVVFLETNYTKSIQEPFTFIYPMKQFVVGGGSDNVSIVEKTEEKYILPLWILVPLGLGLLLLIVICIYKQIKTFLIRRRYRLAMMMQDKNPDVEQADQEKEGNINDEDENQKNKKKVDKINFLN